MKKILFEMFEQTNNLSLENIIMQITVASILGFVIFISYALSHWGTIYSKKFNTSLIILTILTATVMTVIGNNIALSLGMVGALSIVRFRTAIKDSRDTVYIFWTIIVGICCGVGNYMIATIGSSAVFIVLLILGRIRNDNRILLIIKASRNMDMKIEAAIFGYFNKEVQLRVKNTTETNVELIYELSKSTMDKSLKKERNITDVIYDIGNIEYFNMVTQNDEIGS